MDIGTDQTTLDKFQEVAVILGHNWRFNQLKTWEHRIILTNGRKNIFVEYEKNNMFHYCAYVEKRNDIRSQIGYCETTSINLSRNKTARQIASDINKRLLIKANVIMNEYLAKEQNILKELDDKKIRFDLISKILEDKGSKSNFDRSRYYMKLGKINGDMYFRSDFSADINLSGLSFDQVCNLLNYLKQI